MVFQLPPLKARGFPMIFIWFYDVLWGIFQYVSLFLVSYDVPYDVPMKKWRISQGFRVALFRQWRLVGHSPGGVGASGTFENRRAGRRSRGAEGGGFQRGLPSGEPTKSCGKYGKSPFLMGKITISMAIFNC